jgi:WD40-like Beta Propeller Repeat
MKRSWAALAVALLAIFAAIGCNDYGNTFQVPTGAAITSLSPANITAGSPQFTLTVVGSGFVAKTVVQWNGGTIATQVQTDSAGNVIGITATVPASLVAKPGTAFVNTLSPHSGAGTNGLSNPLAFIINPPGNPLPTVTSLSPSCTVAGGAAFTLTVAGSNFLPTSDPSGGSQVLWRAGAGGMQTILATVGSTSATQIQATVTNALIASPGTANVSVFNPPAPQAGSGNGGGGTSQNSPLFTIAATSCPAAAARATAAVQTVGQETPAVSTDGRFVAYTAAQDAHAQVFVRDTCQGAAGTCQPRTILVSAATDGAAGNDDSRSPSMSADGRYIAFSSAATNLLPGAPPGSQIYLRDTCLDARTPCAPLTQLVSTDAQGALAGTEAILPSVSASGRFVTFVAVTPGHVTNSGFRQTFVRDTCLATNNCTPTTVRTP